MDPRADRVRGERLRRNWSVRTAAGKSGISNTYWASFEDGKIPLTPRISDAVAAAFEWDTDWATQPDESDDLRRQVGALTRAVWELLELAGLEPAAWLPAPPAEAAAAR